MNIIVFVLLPLVFVVFVLSFLFSPRIRTSNLASFRNNVSKFKKLGYVLELESINFTELFLNRFEICCMYEKNPKHINICFGMEENVVINGDKLHLARVLDHLIVNIMTYCKDDKIFVELKQSKGYIECNIGSSKDDGGNKNNIFKKILRNLKKSDVAISKIDDLSLVKRIIELHMGGFKVENNGQDGFRYNFYLPKRLKF